MPSPIFLGSVVSQSSPESGQDHRSSPNFSFSVPDGTAYLMCTVTPNSGDNAQYIHFNLLHDKSAWGDSTVFDGVYTGWQNPNYKPGASTTDYSDVYVADPVGASSEFTVAFYALPNQ